MMRRGLYMPHKAFTIGMLLIFSIQAQDLGLVAHPECTYFGAQRDRFIPRRNPALTMTAEVTRQLGAREVTASMGLPPGGTRTFTKSGSTGSSNLIDVFIWKGFQANGVTPA